eukprot:TRINITY_DN4430_c0_g1_i1.p1 TRINITY_DN4430_c0_g1~~TRINITY_DN4430_c0_g1_i1.p1  ORF type:complete len:120 (-),score=16.20 TRINITY_DN4430_c0_g1_i1:70-429(-)
MGSSYLTLSPASQSRMRPGLVLLVVVVFVGTSQQKPQFDFGSLLSNGLGAFLNTAIGRDCKGRPQGDYFYGCQCVGPLNIGRKRRSPQNTNTRFFLNSNQGVGGDFIRCSAATILNRSG